ncbi:MAG TPA: toprim domain-containing protein [Candidatus Paceibacterota bacterium]|nr:toprim domain-containing protein [Candidatus Paceibacterota bacterium]
MDSLERLAELFERFPGIGPRQARRFVYFLLQSDAGFRRELARTLEMAGSAAKNCPECARFHDGRDALCGICANPHRDDAMLTIVATDADLRAMENSGSYKGRYYVLGGTISLAASKQPNLREKGMLDAVQMRADRGLTEVILAFPANPEGDITADHVRSVLGTIASDRGVRITQLGRGLSTGSELEYADSATIQNALDNRR